MHPLIAAIRALQPSPDYCSDTGSARLTNLLRGAICVVHPLIVAICVGQYVGCTILLRQPELCKVPQLITVKRALQSASAYCGITYAFSSVDILLQGVVTSSVVLLALSILTQFFQYIPRATLAAVVIVAVLRTVNIRIIKKIWRVRKIDILPLIVTFFACLYEIAIGIACGIATALSILLYRHFLPRVEFQKGEICYVKLEGGLSYMGVQSVIAKVREVALLNVPKPEAVILDCVSMFECDFTVSQGFLQIVQDCEHDEVRVMFFNVRDNVKKMLISDGLPDELFRADGFDGDFSEGLPNGKHRNSDVLQSGPMLPMLPISEPISSA